VQAKSHCVFSWQWKVELWKVTKIQ